MKKVFVTGGAGYCGGILIPKLLELGYDVTVYDTCYFGKNHLPISHPNLKLIEGDIRDLKLLKSSITNHEITLHLACISNDASFELDENLSTSINLEAFEPLVLIAKESGVKRFIYASSSSVYGVSELKDVKEDHPLLPLTLYNKYKGICEPILNRHASEDFVVTTFRPATVCGFSPRMRFDLSVNILVNHAVNYGKITVFGGSQLRPNLHILDYADVVCLLMTAPKEKIQKEIFNVGGENLSIFEIAQLVKRIVEAETDIPQIKVEIQESNDPRSYHINSDKIKKQLGFTPKRNVEFAVRELLNAFKHGTFSDTIKNDIYYNVRTIKKLSIS